MRMPHFSIYFPMVHTDNERDIEETNIERDLGVVVGKDLKWRGQVDRMVGKMNRTLRLRERLRVRNPKLCLERSLSFSSKAFKILLEYEKRFKRLMLTTLN